MSLEQAMSGVTTEVAKLNATLEKIAAGGGLVLGGGAAAPAGTNGAAATAAETTAAKRGRPPGTAKAPQPTQEEAMAAAFEVRDTIGKPEAQALIKKHGAESLGKLDPKKFTAFIADCKAELAAHEAAQGGGEDDDSGSDDL